MTRSTIAERPSPNQDDRPDDVTAIDTLVLHYTGMKSAEAALERMTDPAAKVSAHWCIDEDGSVTRLVPEERRAWHAGLSYWRGRPLVNDFSIGIELVNPGHEFGYRPFPRAQMDALLELGSAILARHPITAANVVAHSDIAPSRKQDPGELFDWERLAASGIGLWPNGVPDTSTEAPALRRGDLGDAVQDAQTQLHSLGYAVIDDGHFGETTEDVVRAFQRHFRQARVDGVLDGATLAILAHLLTQIAAA